MPRLRTVALSGLIALALPAATPPQARRTPVWGKTFVPPGVRMLKGPEIWRALVGSVMTYPGGRPSDWYKFYPSGRVVHYHPDDDIVEPALLIGKWNLYADQYCMPKYPNCLHIYKDRHGIYYESLTYNRDTTVRPIVLKRSYR